MNQPSKSLNSRSEKCTDIFCFHIVYCLARGGVSAVIHNYCQTNVILCKTTETSPSMITGISLSASWKWCPTTAGTVWGIIISVFHRTPANVFSLPTLCPPVISCTRCPCSDHFQVFMSQLSVSWTDLVSVCRDCRVSRWGKEQPLSTASRNRGGVWARVLRSGGVVLVGL